MVQHYLQGILTAVADLPQVCANCGSRRTEIFGRSNDGKMVGLRCHQCGTRSDVASADDRSGAPGDITAELEAIVAIGKALTRLQNADSRRRVLAWALDRFTAPLVTAAPAEDAPASDQTLTLDDLGDLFAPPRRTDLRLVVANESSSDKLDDLFDGAETPVPIEDDRCDVVDAPDLHDTHDLQDARNAELDVLVADFVSDFRRLANEWENS
jgi:hypothetical protein